MANNDDSRWTSGGDFRDWEASVLLDALAEDAQRDTWKEHTSIEVEQWREHSDVSTDVGLPANVVARIFVCGIGSLCIFAIVACYLAEMFSSTGAACRSASARGGRRLALAAAEVAAMEFAASVSSNRYVDRTMTR